MRRKPKAKVDIDVVPYLSIMVIVLKLITLILIVQVIPIALNPARYKVLTFEDLFTSRVTKPDEIKSPTYFDCRPDQVEIIPGRTVVTFADLREPGNPVEQALDALAKRSDREYAIILVRPRSVQVYRHLRKMLQAYEGLEVGYDVLETDQAIDWDAEAKKAKLDAV